MKLSPILVNELCTRNGLRGVFTLVLLWSSAVFARFTTTPVQPENSQATPSQIQTSPTAAPLINHTNCGAFIPPSLTRPFPTALALLVSVHIMPNGDVQRATLFRSSGDADWDKVAIDCADGYHIAPISIAGKPAEFDWVLRFHGSLIGSGFVTPMLEHAPCDLRSAMAQSKRPPPQAKTVISYPIKPDGTVGDATVTQSSGATLLDEQVAKCVKDWRFLPATQNGGPVTIDREYSVSWGLP